MRDIDMDNVGLLAADWDETITSEDTLSLVSQAAYETKPDFPVPWDQFVSDYMKDYTEYVKDKRRETLSQEASFLRGITDVEYNSVQRVENSGLFKGVPLSALHKQAERVPIRKGWWDVLARLRGRGIPVVVISVNWSIELICRVFELNGYQPGKDVDIFANRISMDENNIGTGVLTDGRQIRTAQDKADIIDELRQSYKIESPKSLCYIGDSGTDLLALVKADHGVVIHKGRLMESCERLGLDKIQFSYQWDDIFA